MLKQSIVAVALLSSTLSQAYFGESMVDGAYDKASSAVSWVKKNPGKTALGVAALGLAGVLTYSGVTIYKTQKTINQCEKEQDSFVSCLLNSNNPQTLPLAVINGKIMADKAYREAIRSNQKHFVKALINAGIKHDNLISLSTSLNNIDMIRFFMMEEGIKDKSDVAVYQASKGGNKEIVSFLLSHGYLAQKSDAGSQICNLILKDEATLKKIPIDNEIKAIVSKAVACGGEGFPQATN